MFTHNKKLYDWLLSMFLLPFFRGDFVRIRRSLPKEFSVKQKILFLSSTKSGYAQTQNGNGIVFEYFVLHTDKERLLLSPLPSHSPNFYLALISISSRSRYKNSVRLQGYERKSLEWFLAAPTHLQLDDTLLNIPSLCLLWKHCTMHR